MTTSPIILDQRDSIAIVRMNRPEKLNALSSEMIESLNDVFNQLETQPSLRAIILTGTGDRAFCAGTDISELAELTKDAAARVSKRGQALCNQIENFPVPVIAAINGVAVGGGCELALATHIRVASDSARFGLPETKLGVIPGYGGTQRLSRELGQSLALEIMLAGRTLSAEEAFHHGLVNRLTKSSQLLPAAESIAGEISKLAPLAIRACLRAITRGLEMPLDQGLALETELFASLFDTEDMREGTRAFLEKRPPAFKGS